MEQIIVEEDIDTKFDETRIQLKKFFPEVKYPPSLGLDHPSVKKVIQIALELTKEHRLINSELLYNRAKKELKIPKRGLKTIIQMLLKKKILVDGSRFTILNVLNNQIRHKIYLIIKSIIGVHFSLLKELISIQKEREIGVGQLNWHIQKLLKFNLIKKVKVKNYIIFLPVETDDNIGIIYFILRDKINRKIVDFILNQDIINKSDIYNQLELKRENLYYRIKNLIELNILSPVSEDESITINQSKKDLLRDVISNISHEIRNTEKNKLISIEA